MKIQKVIRKALQKRGYELRKIDRFKAALEKEYNTTEIFRFVQVGANDGIRFDDLFSFVATRPCQGLVVEPLSYYYKMLELTYAGFDEIKPVNVAIHRSKKEATIHYPDPEKIKNLPEWSRGIGSFNPDHHKRVSIPCSCMTSEKVRCLPLMELLSRFDFFDINLLQIDAEGYDAEIVKMIDFERVAPAVIKYENTSLTPDDGKEVQKLLRANGYSLFTQEGNDIAIKHNKNK